MNLAPKVVGIPEFWATAYEVNPAGFDAIYELGLLFQKLRDQRVEGQLPALLGRLMTATYKSLGAVTTLALNGFDADAMKIARSMFEYEVIGAYLRKHPDRVEDYFAFIRVSLHEDYHWIQQHAPEDLTTLHEDTHNRLLAELGKIDSSFRKKSGALKKSWKDVQLAEMAQETDRDPAYRSMYRWGSGLVHGDATMLASNRGGIEIEPSTYWTHTALKTAHCAVLSLMADFNEEGKLGLDGEIVSAIKTFLTVWQPTEIKPRK
jgi:hypothetical protein